MSDESDPCALHGHNCPGAAGPDHPPLTFPSPTPPVEPLAAEEVTHALNPLRSLAKYGAASAPTLYKDQAQIIVAYIDALATENQAMRRALESFAEEGCQDGGRCVVSSKVRTMCYACQAAECLGD